MSICVPAFNQPEFLRRTLDSVAEQSFQDYEVVITDDSSNDAVANAAGKYLADPRFRYYRNTERQGTPENWNEAIRRARAPLIKLLHHDDWFADRTSLETFVKLLDKNPAADFAFCSSLIVDEHQQLLYTSRPSEKQLRALSADARYLFGGNLIGAPSATIFRKEGAPAFDPNLKMLVDIDFYIALLRKNPKFAFCASPGVSTTLSDFQVSATYRRNGSLQLAELVYLRNKLGFSRFNVRCTYQFIRQAVGLLGMGGFSEPSSHNGAPRALTLEMRVALWLHAARRLMRKLRRPKTTLSS